ncbi:MAG: SurA N-terminal domain-containing protein [Parvularculaceae bacterium]
MLNQIRKTLKNVSWIFAIPLIGAFALWGVPEMRSFTSSPAIRVGKDAIGLQTLQREFDRMVTSQRNQSGEDFDRQKAIQQGMGQQLIQSLATQAALDQQASRMGLIVTRKQVGRFLQTQPQFQNPATGKFDQAVLDDILRTYNFSEVEFANRIGEEILRQQLISAVSAGGAAPHTMINYLAAREVEKRKVSFLTITEQAAGDETPATDETLKAYYDAHLNQFMAPEYRSFTLVTLKNADFADQAAVSDEELKKAYEAAKSRYEKPEQRTVYQIVFQDAAKAASAAEALKNGEPFEKIAQENGKSLADVTLTDITKTDILDPKVAAAAFAKDAGDGAVIGPVKGTFGSTVLQVASIAPSETKSFEEAKPDLEKEILASQSKKGLYDAVEQIENERDTGASLADAANQLDLKVQEIGPVDAYSFGKGGEIIGDITGEILKTAFSLEEGEESEANELADNSGYYFVAVNEVTAPAAIPFDQVKTEVESRWRSEENDSRIDNLVKKIRDAIDAGKSLKEAGADVANLAPITEIVERRAQGGLFSPALLDQIFSADKGDVVSGPAANGSSQVIVAIDDVEFDADKIKPEDVSAYSTYMGSQLNQELVDAFAGSVRDDAKVKINTTQVDQLFSEDT